MKRCVLSGGGVDAGQCAVPGDSAAQLQQHGERAGLQGSEVVYSRRSLAMSKNRVVVQVGGFEEL